MQVLPQFCPAEWVAEHSIVGLRFSSAVCVGLVERVDSGYSYVTQEQFNLQDNDVSGLLSAALSNLAELTPTGVSVHVARPPGATVIWIEAPDNFAAIRMLLPSVKARLNSELGPGFLFTIPSRDLCLCWNAGAPAELSAKHAAEATEDFHQEEHNLTAKVLVYSDVWPCAEAEFGG